MWASSAACGTGPPKTVAEAPPCGRWASVALASCLLQTSPKAVPSEQAPTFSALVSGPSFPVNSFPSERKCFVLFLFVSYPIACWFLVHFSNIHHFLVCVRLHMCVYLVCCVFLAAPEACCANAALSHPGQPLASTPTPALVLSQAPRVRVWLAGTSGSHQGPRSQGYRILGKPKAPGWEAGVQRKRVTVETSPGRGICECWWWRK